MARIDGRPGACGRRLDGAPTPCRMTREGRSGGACGDGRRRFDVDVDPNVEFDGDVDVDPTVDLDVDLGSGLDQLDAALVARLDRAR
jgi:hypothetical protein